MSKKYLIIILMLVMPLLLIIIGTDRIRNYTWHLFHDNSIVYNNMQIELTNEWWEYANTNDLIIFRIPENHKKPLSLSFSKKKYNITGSTITNMISKICSSGAELPNKIIIDKEVAIETACKPVSNHENTKELLWIIPSKRIVILSDNNEGKEHYNKLFSNIHWLDNK